MSVKKKLNTSRIKEGKMKPSNEQRNKLWERCGLKRNKYGYWELPDGPYKEIPTDLNNLFRFAVPDDCTIQFQQHGDELECVIYYSNEWYSGRAGKREYADALFWALKEALCNH